VLLDYLVFSKNERYQYRVPDNYFYSPAFPAVQLFQILVKAGALSLLAGKWITQRTTKFVKK